MEKAVVGLIGYGPLALITGALASCAFAVAVPVPVSGVSAHSILTVHVSTLNHEVIYDPVKNREVVPEVLCVGNEVLNMNWCQVLE